MSITTAQAGITVRGTEPRSQQRSSRVYVEMDLGFTASHRQRIEAMRQAATDRLDAAGLLGSKKLRFSQKAGCSCGCSPAFIVTNASGQPCWITDQGNFILHNITINAR